MLSFVILYKFECIQEFKSFVRIDESVLINNYLFEYLKTSVY